MSDGRPIPQAFDVETLDIYPGERFTVLITPEANWDGTIDAEFWNMADNFVEDTQSIRIRDTALDLDESTAISWNGFPNPAQNIIHYPPALDVMVWDAWGREVFNGDILDGQLSIKDWPDGTYILRSGNGPISRFVVIN
jgi:hypothetical protein